MANQKKTFYKYLTTNCTNPVDQLLLLKSSMAELSKLLLERHDGTRSKLFLERFFKMGHSRPRFLYFCLFNTVDSKQIIVRYKSLLMTGFEPLTSGVESDCSTDWVTTTVFVWPCSSLMLAYSTSLYEHYVNIFLFSNIVSPSLCYTISRSLINLFSSLSLSFFYVCSSFLFI